MTRRTFLSRTGAAALAASLGASSLTRGAGAGRRIPLGFLGAAHSHAAAKLELALKSSDWEFVGVADSSAAGRQVAEKAGARLISPSELFERAAVVAVESDNRDHARQALAALDAGKHVHLEKPAAASLADLRAVIARAREKQRLLQVGYMWRYHPGFRAILDTVRQGWLGEVYLVRGFISNNLARARRPEWAEFVGGSMFDLGSHLVDATVRLLGAPKSVTPFLGHHGRFDDALNDNNVAVLEFARARAVLFNTALQAGGTPQRSFEVLGTKGTATLQPIEPGKLSFDLTEAAGPYRKGPQEVSLPPYRRYEADLIELAAAVRGEKPLGVGLDEELVVGEAVLRASGMG